MTVLYNSHCAHDTTRNRKRQKQLCEKFIQLGLQITANANTTVTDFLDISFDIKKKEHKPYTKPG